MTNAELLAKIKAEIERLLNEAPTCDDTIAYLMKVECFLDTLESEKPMNQEGFSKEFDEYFLPKNSEQKGRWGFADIFSLARHFAEWGAEHLAGVRKMIGPKKKEGRTDCSSQGEVPNDSLATQSYEKIPKDLEEAADDYAKQNTEEEYHTDEGIIQTYGIAYEAFIAGAKWQKEQMTKEAVEGYIERDYGGQLILGRSNTPAGDEFMILGGSLFPEIHAGERREVRVIIVKE